MSGLWSSFVGSQRSLRGPKKSWKFFTNGHILVNHRSNLIRSGFYSLLDNPTFRLIHTIMDSGPQSMRCSPNFLAFFSVACYGVWHNPTTLFNIIPLSLQHLGWKGCLVPIDHLSTRSLSRMIGPTMNSIADLTKFFLCPSYPGLESNLSIRSLMSCYEWSLACGVDPSRMVLITHCMPDQMNRSPS